MSNRHFRELLEARWTENKFVCIGLDPVKEKIPTWAKTGGLSDNIARFLREIVEATADLACAYKPNLAFFEGLRTSNDMGLLQRVIKDIRQIAPSVPVILDFKRGDIGNSNLGSIALFDWLEADACTVNGLLGQETWQPLLDRPEIGVFVLCRTSNPGATEFQEKDIVLEQDEFCQLTGESRCGEVDFYRLPFHAYVALRVAKVWNANNNCGLVVGATAPEQLALVRDTAPDLTFLIPGVGKQGGEVKTAVRNGVNNQGTGIIVNASSSILYASSGSDSGPAARIVIEQLTDEVNGSRKKEIISC